MHNLFTPQFHTNLEVQLARHSLVYTSPPKSTYAEELVVNALKATYPLYQINWTPESHQLDYDISVKNDPYEWRLSLKTGKPMRSTLSISGPRLQSVLKAASATPPLKAASTTQLTPQQGEALVSHLRHVAQSALMLSLCKPTPSSDKYWFTELPPALLEPPPWESWTPRGSVITGVNAKGTVLRICTSMSWQIWWDVPLQELPIRIMAPSLSC